MGNRTQSQLVARSEMSVLRAGVGVLVREREKRGVSGSNRKYDQRFTCKSTLGGSVDRERGGERITKYRINTN